MQFWGLDVRTVTITVTVALEDGDACRLGVTPNRTALVRKLIRKLGAAESLRACHEAGPTGYVQCWQSIELDVDCAVAVPTVVPTKAVERVKTDRRDAAKLAL